MVCIPKKQGMYCQPYKNDYVQNQKYLYRLSLTLFISDVSYTSLSELSKFIPIVMNIWNLKTEICLWKSV